jgi:hypothetical protein
MTATALLPTINRFAPLELLSPIIPPSPSEVPPPSLELTSPYKVLRSKRIVPDPTVVSTPKKRRNRKKKPNAATLGNSMQSDTGATFGPDVKPSFDNLAPRHVLPIIDSSPETPNKSLPAHSTHGQTTPALEGIVTDSPQRIENIKVDEDLERLRTPLESLTTQSNEILGSLRQERMDLEAKGTHPPFCTISNAIY